MPSSQINRIFRDDQRLDARGGEAVRPIDWRVLSAILPGSHAGESSPRAISAAVANPGTVIPAGGSSSPRINTEPTVERPVRWRVVDVQPDSLTVAIWKGRSSAPHPSGSSCRATARSVSRYNRSTPRAVLAPGHRSTILER